MVVVTLAVPVRTWFDQRAEIAQLEAEVQAASARVDDLKVQAERWQDPAFVASEARKRLHFVMPGEVGYVVLDDKGQPVLEADEVEVVNNDPWYAKLWNGLQEADDASDAAISR